MRKLLLFVCLAFMSLITDAQVVKSVNVEEAGTLQALLGNDYLNITDLTVTGIAIRSRKSAFRTVS